MKLTSREIAVFSMLGALMYVTKFMMQMLPNIHLLGVFIIAIPLTYRKKALYPIYIYVFIEGLLSGFDVWWLPYLYIWTVLWGMSMLIPVQAPRAVVTVLCMTVCALHGFLFGILYAPVQALVFGLDFEGMVAWIVAGAGFDFIHGVSNFLCGALVVVISGILNRCESMSSVRGHNKKIT